MILFSNASSAAKKLRIFARFPQPNVYGGWKYDNEKRTLYYWSKQYSGQLEEGKYEVARNMLGKALHMRTACMDCILQSIMSFKLRNAYIDDFGRIQIIEFKFEYFVASS